MQDVDSVVTQLRQQLWLLGEVCGGGGEDLSPHGSCQRILRVVSYPVTKSTVAFLSISQT